MKRIEIRIEGLTFQNILDTWDQDYSGRYRWIGCTWSSGDGYATITAVRKETEG